MPHLDYPTASLLQAEHLEPWKTNELLRIEAINELKEI